MLRKACHTATVVLPRVAAIQAAECRPERVFCCTGGQRAFKLLTCSLLHCFPCAGQVLL